MRRRRSVGFGTPVIGPLVDDPVDRAFPHDTIHNARLRPVSGPQLGGPDEQKQSTPRDQKGPCSSGSACRVRYLIELGSRAVLESGSGYGEAGQRDDHSVSLTAVAIPTEQEVPQGSFSWV